MPNSYRDLHNARIRACDEFYTLLSVVENEIKHYKKHLKGKTILCNCDDPESSAFWKHFKLKYQDYGIRKLIATHYTPIEGKTSYKLEFTQKDGIVETPLKGNGDFRNLECIELLKEADIVITNPPFSLFREYIQQLMDFRKKFIIIGNLNAIAYKQIIPFFLKRKVWVGVSSAGYWFKVPDTLEKLTKNIRYDKEGSRMHWIPQACWFTNHEHAKTQQDLICYAEYKSENYPKYDNYDAIEVSRYKEIPTDYEGKMGVPMSFIFKHNPKQFKIIGTNRTVKTTNGKGDFYINGKCVYMRLVIQRIK